MLQSERRPMPIVLLPLQSKPRIFVLEYDNSRAKSRNPWTNQQKMMKLTNEGTLYSNGRVTLDSGVCFESLDEMEQHYAIAGVYTSTWQDEV